MSSAPPNKILANLQHHGFKTNLIDFTSDFLVALFFACDEEEDATGQDQKLQDGRLLLLSRMQTYASSAPQWDDAWERGFFTGKGSNMVPTQEIVAKRLPWALAMPETGRRLQSQKSVLVHAPMGFVEPDQVIIISSTLKDALLRYLDKYHDINATAMYSDLHGFIRYRRSHRSHSAGFFCRPRSGGGRLLRSGFRAFHSWIVIN